MTIQEAKDNIGKPFKYELCAHWDIIREVDSNDYIKGDFLWVPPENCRLKQEQPEQLKKYNATKSSEGDSLCQP